MDHELTEEEKRAERNREMRAHVRQQARAVIRMCLVPAACAVGIGAVWVHLSSSMGAAVIVASIFASIGNAISTAIVTKWDVEKDDQ
jgi:hypothetical protein